MPPATVEHTTKAFDLDLQVLARMTSEMGGHAEKQIVEAVDALRRRDRALGRKVIVADELIDERQREIEQKAVETIATRQPMAADLREIVGVLRIVGNLERVGDLAKNIAKRVLLLDGERIPRRTLYGISHMTSLAIGLMRDALDSYCERDVDKAVAVWKRDEEIDALYTSLFRELLTDMIEDPGILTLGVHLLFCAKNIERIGDHATNIAESVYYIVEGQSFGGERPKADLTTAVAAEPGSLLVAS